MGQDEAVLFRLEKWRVGSIYIYINTFRNDVDQ